MRIRHSVYRILPLLVAVTFLSGCSSGGQYSKYPGVRNVGPIGNPPARTLVWSPQDPHLILVNSSGFTAGRANVKLLNIDTHKTKTLVEVEFGSVTGDAWSPDGLSIALSISGSRVDAPRPGLWIMKVEDRSTLAISQEVGNAVWLPSGDVLGSFRMKSGSQPNARRLAVYLVNIHTGSEKLIYSNGDKGWFDGASVSPDGKEFVFALSSFSNISDIYLLHLASGKLTQLTQNGSSTAPAWSPNGNLIAYNRGRNQSGQAGSWLHLMDPNGNCDIEIQQFSDASSPTWSPDGRQLAFIGSDGIYVADLATFLGREVSKGLCSTN